MARDGTRQLFPSSPYNGCPGISISTYVQLQDKVAARFTRATYPYSLYFFMLVVGKELLRSVKLGYLIKVFNGTMYDFFCLTIEIQLYF
ncbi:hypothetical protein SAMN03097708_00885 [Thiohalomonas denitrificans]|uniref:Uncharacterized protein n=1 Tax=Thiohalomonas denitrificans TaxID=415747 RepID=A0A1G5PVB4_9GAMM|nr:hypothetical protein SAMN03097708_00885 [Thiohalomonas denitrificans]